MHNLKHLAESKGYTFETLMKDSGLDELTLRRYWNNSAGAIELAHIEIMVNLLNVSADSIIMINPRYLMSDKFSD